MYIHLHVHITYFKVMLILLEFYYIHNTENFLYNLMIIYLLMIQIIEKAPTNTKNIDIF